MRSSDQTALKIEQAAFRAFPALEEEHLDGWLLRYANGQSRRINSVQPIDHQGDVDSKVAAVEAWYAQRETPVTYRMTPMSVPSELDSILESGGYFRQDPTSVQTMSIAGRSFETDARIEIVDHPTGTWFDIIMGASRYMAGRRPTLEETLRMIEPPTAFAVMREHGEAIGTGLAVADGDLVGLFSISTRSEFRRRGNGRIMSETLLAWGQSRGATLAYLQVMYINSGAWELYERMGFEPLYDYWYRSPVDRPPMKG